MTIITIGLELAKQIFQVRGVDEADHVVVTGRLRRAPVVPYFASLPPCLIGMEACSSAYFWGRELRSLGHEVRLIPPQYVKACVKRGKNDDDAAICEAVARPCMRFIPVKTAEQQSALVLHRARQLLVRQRTQLINAIRGHLAEFGLIVGRGPWNLSLLLASLEADRRVPDSARQLVQLLAAQLADVKTRIAEVDAQIVAWQKVNLVSQRLATIPGVGPLIAAAIAATVPDPKASRSGREFSAWLALVLRQQPTGGKPRLGRISRLGGKYIRQLLIVGAQTVLLRSKVARSNACIHSLLARRPRLVVAVALANKTARIVWTVMANGQRYRQTAPA